MQAKIIPIGLLVLLGGCRADEAPAPSSWSPGSALTVELPGLERQEAATRDRLRHLHARASATLDRDPPEPEAVAEAFGELGTHLAAVGILAGAADAFENARQADSTSFRWHYLLAVTRQDDSRLEEAVDAYGDALAAGAPDQVHERAARLHRVDALLELGRLDEAELDLEAVRRLGEEDSAAFLFAAGRLAAGQDRHEDAVALFERALDQDPAASAVRYPLSQSYMRLGDRNAADNHAARRGEKKPRFPDPISEDVGRLVSLTALEVVRSRAAANDFDPVADLGFALANLSQIGGAAEQLERILAGDARPTRPVEEARLRYLVGGLWVARYQDARAEPHFRRAVEADPSFAAAWVKLGNVAARSERFPEAYTLYSKAMEVSSAGISVDAALKRAAAAWALGRGQDASRDLEAALEQADEPGTIAQVVVDLAATWDRLGQAERAERLLREALAEGPERTEPAKLHKAVGDRYRRAERFEDALAAYEKALSLAPDLTEAGLEAAAVLGHLGRLDASARAYNDVLIQTPTSILARRGEVTALLLAGRYREASRSLRHAVDLFPEESSLEWRHALARLLAACPDSAVRDGVEALSLAEAVFEYRPSLKHGETLAMAYAATGNYEQAAVIQRNLIDEVRKAGHGDMIPNLQRRLSLYEQNQPFLATGPDVLIVTAPVSGDT